jgi:hypothetical protein
MWGLLFFYSIIIISFYGLKLIRSQENFDVSSINGGNAIMLDSEYSSTMPNIKMDDIYSYTPEPVPNSSITGNSNVYNGSPGFLGGSTLSASSISGNVRL